jgi:hypothetical protein
MSQQEGDFFTPEEKTRPCPSQEAEELSIVDADSDVWAHVYHQSDDQTPAELVKLKQDYTTFGISGSSPPWGGEMVKVGNPTLGVSRHHCRVIKRPGELAQLEDLSTNGTTVNQYRRLNKSKTDLMNKSTFRIGKHTYLFIYTAPSEGIAKDYRLHMDRKLGEGSFGAVYEAKDRRAPYEHVAVKIIDKYAFCPFV